MSKSLLIVESPAKSKTLKKYLGGNFEILASYGHVRDLVPKEGAVDPENHFAMRYEVIERNEKHVDAICEKLKKVDTLYLATDPDREGEAISWHLLELIKERNALNGTKVKRVVFNEITKNAVLEAIENPRDLAGPLINAQQARRGLDYLVGFKLSPLLWKKIRRGLSAGRVQSPALRMIVERQAEIDAFKPREYWSCEADLKAGKQGFTAKLTEYDGKKITQFSITNEKEAKKIEKVLVGAAGGELIVEKITKKQRKRNPTAPFTTSTLQQEASRKLGFSASRTMRVAQQLYEGIDVGQGAEGLITYMRTDSVTLSNDAVEEIREFIQGKYGQKSLPKTPKVYKTKAKNAQEAHEAIRPTHATLLPGIIKSALTGDQYKLYNLIWKRTIASQMIHATLNQVAVDLSCGQGNTFRATGSTIANAGFMEVYLEGVDEGVKEEKEKLLPSMEEGEKIPLQKIRTEQHFTEPPPKFSEASLVKTLEEHGIGRPSTYASIISTLQQREYCVLENKRFIPTDVGKIVAKFLTQYFTQYVDYDFTAKLEDELDSVARGEKDWIPLMDNFWKPFIAKVQEIDKSVQRKDVTQEAIDEKCPKCEKPLAIRLGRRGRFIGCTGYPDCDYTRNVDGEKNAPEEPPEIIEDRNCPKCDSQLQVRHGRFGKFIGCTGYPKCKFIEPLEKPEETEVTCPECKKGVMTKRRSRYGTYFYSCNKYPDCKYAIKNPPVTESCPTCQWPILTIKTTKRRGTEKVCPQKECDYAITLAPPEASAKKKEGS